MITSPANEKVKFARALAHKKERTAAHKFLIEGTRLIQEAARAGLIPALVFYERAAFRADPHLRAMIVAWEREKREVYEASASVIKALSDTETPQGIAAVFPLPALPPPPDPALALIIDRVRDPGNLGTMLRTAWAAGVGLTLLAPETADAYNPKVVRAAMGAHFYVPIVAASWQEIAARTQGIERIYLSDAASKTDYTRADWTAPVALIVGGEAEGAGAEAHKLATAKISIPMPGSAESLNAAVATGILLFQAVRPR
ncbi:MAG: RNA methyltransferase [Anaerolineae bacterium]|nr:RNA methyltransferase [Anaerolineae bacterium]